MPLELTTELGEVTPPRGERSGGRAGLQSDTVDGVSTCAASIVTHQAWFKPGHVAKEEVGNLNVWYRVPRVSHPALISLPCRTPPLRLQIPDDGAGHIFEFLEGEATVLVRRFVSIAPQWLE